MRRAWLGIAVVAGLVCVAPPPAIASASTSSTSYFVTRLGPEVIPGYTHVSGVGVSGQWHGWHLTMDYVVSTDCYDACPIELMRWQLYDGDRKVWGTCTADEYGFCVGAGIRIITNEVTIPLTITGGTTWMDSGTGEIGGHILMPPETSPAFGAVTFRLAPV